MSALLFYRLGNYFYRINIPILPFVGKAIIRIVFNCAIDPKAIIGKNCVITQDITIGKKQNSIALPIIGNDVQIGEGVVILGEHCVIGSNTVVLKSIPPYSVVTGVPAKIIKSIRSEFLS